MTHSSYNAPVNYRGVGFSILKEMSSLRSAFNVDVRKRPQLVGC